MKIFLVFVFGIVTQQVFAQYYYTDIVALQQSIKQYRSLKENNIHAVSAVSYEGSEVAEDFSLEQIISNDASQVIIHSEYPSAGKSSTINSYENNHLVNSIDSNSKVTTVTKYQYNAQNQLTSITTQTSDAFMNNHAEEIHLWFYKDDKPDHMLRIKDKTDTTLINLVYDEQANVAQENWLRKGRTQQTYYYYYNSAKQLTDVVQYNARAKRMLPDFIFEYDANSNISSMTQVPSGSSDYMIWKYSYNDKGLKQQELLYSRQNQLIGRIAYNYK